MGFGGRGQALAIGLSVVTAPGEWPWGYYMLIGIHLVLFATAAGAYAGVDGVRARGGGEAAWRGLGVAGAVATVVAVGSLPFTVGDPLAGSGSPPQPPPRGRLSLRLSRDVAPRPASAARRGRPGRG